MIMWRGREWDDFITKGITYKGDNTNDVFNYESDVVKVPNQTHLLTK